MVLLHVDILVAAVVVFVVEVLVAVGEVTVVFVVVFLSVNVLLS